MGRSEKKGSLVERRGGRCSRSQREKEGVAKGMEGEDVKCDHSIGIS